MAETFGKQFRENEFMLEEGTVFLNHGSYGTVPRRVYTAQRALVEEMETHPDYWFR